MASGPITSWQIIGEKVETETDFIFLGSKSTVDSDCSHKIKRCLLHWTKAMTRLGSGLKSRAFSWRWDAFLWRWNWTWRRKPQPLVNLKTKWRLKGQEGSVERCPQPPKEKKKIYIYIYICHPSSGGWKYCGSGGSPNILEWATLGETNLTNMPSSNSPSSPSQQWIK